MTAHHETPTETIIRRCWAGGRTIDSVLEAAAELRGAATAAHALGHPDAAEELRAAGRRLWDDYRAHRAETAGRTAA